MQSRLLRAHSLLVLTRDVLELPREDHGISEKLFAYLGSIAGGLEH